MKYPIFALLLFLLFSCDSVDYGKLQDPLSSSFDSSLAPFYHGVASGDPLSDAVVIWTKITPEDSIPEIKGQWEMASDEGFSDIVKTGDFNTDIGSSYTVKVDVQGLSEGTVYYYRFKALDKHSIVGRTKTAGSSDALKFAVVSCSNYEFGFFNGYAAIAERNDLDAVLHLGDYIYEYGPGSYGDSTTNRFHMPPHEIISLQDYRTRYSQYRLDPDLRAVHQNHPMIAIWDDHEIANDSFSSGAQNHQADEGDYEVRKQVARQAYYEWLPVRESPELYRSFSYGDMASVIMLDERLAGRTAPVASASDPNINSTERAMLGEPQLTWFKNELADESTQWKLIGNQVIFSYLNWGFAGFSVNLDSWDGYPAERASIIEHIESNSIENVVFVAGDTHSSWALEVTDDPFGSYKSQGAIAVEYGTPSINSGNSDERSPTEEIIEHEKNIVSPTINPQLKYTNMRDHGYLEIGLYRDRAEAKWYYTSTNKQRSAQMSLAAERITPANSNKIISKQ